jgi:putative hydrolase of the HAD superfamily
MIKLLIFDLDNTLFDTHGQLGIRVLDQMVERMKKAGLTKEQEDIIRERYHMTGFRILASQLGLSDKIRNIGIETYKKMDLAHIKPFDDVNVVSEFGQKKVLVTSGINHIQLKKVEILKIGELFDEIIVDEASSFKNKQDIFEMVMEKHFLKPKEIMVIGDNPESEIAAANALGMVSVQILRKSHIIKGKADYYVKDLHGVKKVLKVLNNEKNKEDSTIKKK